MDTIKVLLIGLQIAINAALLDMAAICAVAFASGGIRPQPTSEQCWLLAAVFIVLLVVLNVTFNVARSRAR